MLALLSPLFANPGESLALVVAAHWMFLILIVSVVTVLISLFAFIFKSRIAAGIALLPAILLTFNLCVAFSERPDAPWTGPLRMVAVLGMVAVVAAGAAAVRAFREDKSTGDPSE